MFAPNYPKGKTEGWWVVVGNVSDNTLLSISRVPNFVGSKHRVKLDFVAPETAGKHDLSIYLMCDAYLRCDQE